MRSSSSSRASAELSSTVSFIKKSGDTYRTLAMRIKISATGLASPLIAIKVRIMYHEETFTKTAYLVYIGVLKLFDNAASAGF